MLRHVVLIDIDFFYQWWVMPDFPTELILALMPLLAPLGGLRGYLASLHPEVSCHRHH